jgi:4-hydroxythreonine-4-phosphate dehydrogenase
VIPLALTLGEPGGIGPEITVAAWRTLRADGPAFALFGDARLVAARARAAGLGEVPIREVEIHEAEATFRNALPVVGLRATVADMAGVARSETAAAVVESIDRAVEAVVAGAARAVVTNPINKAALYAASFAHPGHTEYLGALATRLTGEAATPVMMLASDDLRVVPVTVHVALARVPALLDVDLIVRTGRIVARELARRFGLPAPRLAVAGLNPHAGENGTMGEEDERIVRPAVARLRAEGIDATGPLSADTMFHAAARARYDAALACITIRR